MANNTKRFLAGTAAAALAFSLAACGSSSDDNESTGSSSGEATKGGTLTYYLSAPLGHTDPQRTYTGRDVANFRRTVYRSLVAFPIADDAKTANTPVPDLATDTGTATDNSKTWSFTLKDGVKWQDGSDVTCEDFKYGASRVFATDVITGGPNYLLSYLDVPKDPSTGLPSYTGPYKSTPEGQAAFDKAITCDGKTITYHFNKPWPDFPLAVASLEMMDPYKKDQDKGDLSNYSIFSNGPYMIDGGTTAWDKDKGATLVRNPNYDAATDSTDIRKALPDKITFDVGKTPETVYGLMINNSPEAQAAVAGSRLTPALIPQITDKSLYANVDSPYTDYLVPNTKRLSLPVRQALATATNKKAWITAGGGDKFYKPADSIVNTAVTGYQPNPAFKDIPLEGDPAAAKKILQDAGVQMPYPIKFTFDNSSGSDVPGKQAAALKETWDQAGFKVTLDPQTDAYYPAIQKPNGDSDITWAGWGADWPSAITVTAPLFDSRINLTKNSNGQDYGNYKSDAFNALVDKAQNATSIDEQTKALQDADIQLGKDYAYIPLEQSLFNWAWGSKVANFTADASSNMYPDLGAIGVKQ
ncbi:ABC transporter substrate-binding protein [Nocardioides sp. Kera G14]|uniref:ABC transporter substrate-binding protein n=1 Tax=Nocardioides sp. Kera G14 TaxID=2884264 RepID=UPI001D110622|nr:ABC transporter substrate-binding protein [Nocardioides sp. Kera G14]UDY22171.1 ABC transporter substrate-binding protein [Nocardioides sp. Kera G14]